jgi:endonuclease/exonuclease/phosphatase family metal-dependent hydrolase
VLLTTVSAGCDPDPAADRAAIAAGLDLPPLGDPVALDVATWNLEWFGSGHFGPSDEQLQRANVGAVIAGLELDVWAVQEVVSASHFANLVSDLDGYTGLLASDPSVEGHEAYHGGEQKVGFVVRDQAAAIASARVILAEHDFAFAGRPPLEIELEVAGETVVAIVFHGKAKSDREAWERRRDGAEALADYLEDVRPDQPVLVIGDYNDDLDESTRSSSPSPYQVLVESYFFATGEIAAADISTTIGGGLPLDHALVAGPLELAYRPDSAEVFRADDFIPGYGSTTSDHFPVFARFELGAPPAQGVLLNEILANEPGAAVAGEMIELVNPGSIAIDLEGWTLSDEIGLRHRFDPDAVLPGGAALVVSGGASFDPAPTVFASEGTLGLNNAGDVVTLRDADGALVDQVVYGSSLGDDDGVSMTRERDGDPGAPMVSHEELAGVPASPGRRADGTPF